MCIGNWLSEELTANGVSDEARRKVQALYNRKSRAMEDLFDLAAKIMNKEPVDGSTALIF